LFRVQIDELCALGHRLVNVGDTVEIVAVAKNHNRELAIMQLVVSPVA